MPYVNGVKPQSQPASPYVQYDPSLSAAQNSQNMVQNQNQNYQDFLTKLPQYQNTLNNQTFDQGAAEYNKQKQNIDQSANSRGLLYSGLKQGAEASAANDIAGQTQNKIMQNNANLNNYATNYGSQVSQSNIANQQGNVSAALQNYGYGLQQQAQNNQMLGGLLSGAATLGGAALIASDEKLKDNVKNADSDADDMVDKLDAKSYSYKEDPEKKEHMGILAQDLEKSPMGKAIVVETPEGKHVDAKKALSAVLAVQSVLNKRLKKVEAA